MSLTLRVAVTILVAYRLLNAQEKPQPHSAREYFEEMRDAGQFKSYVDKYVCFKEDATEPGFAVVAVAEDVVDEMTRNHDVANLAKLKGVHGLFVKTFYKGVQTGDIDLYERIDGGYSLDFKESFNGRITYLINWTTGRYRLQIFDLDKNKFLPVMEAAGKCELIHPWDTPTVVQ